MNMQKDVLITFLNQTVSVEPTFAKSLNLPYIGRVFILTISNFQWAPLKVSYLGQSLRGSGVALYNSTHVMQMNPFQFIRITIHKN